MELDDNNLKALVSLLSDEDIEIIQHVENQILLLGDKIIPYLEKEWETNFNQDIQKKIEELIHKLQFTQLKSRLIHWKEYESEDLLKGMWIISTYQYPDLEYQKLKSDFEQLFYSVWVEMDLENVSAHDQVKLLNLAFYNKLKFAANTKNFHSASNSMLNIVLETKKGNPISLCVIYMLVAQKLKMPVYGVNLPNLFILTYKDQDQQFYINAFNKGVIFTKEDIDNYLSQLNIKSNPIFYQPCSHVDIVRRVLRNLMLSFEKLGEIEHYREVEELLEAIIDQTDTDNYN